MNFCSQCGARVTLSVPPGDCLPRHVCAGCGTIHYVNPKLVVGCIVESGERIVLCQRAISPRYGRWTLPAGFMENGETTAEAAVRETFEEARARVEIAQPFALISVPHINQVHLFYRARLLGDEIGAGLETLEVALVHEEQIPWTDLAFPTVIATLRAYFSDRRHGHFVFHDDDFRVEAAGRAEQASAARSARVVEQERDRQDDTKIDSA